MFCGTFLGAAKLIDVSGDEGLAANDAFLGGVRFPGKSVLKLLVALVGAKDRPFARKGLAAVLAFEDFCHVVLPYIAHSSA